MDQNKLIGEKIRLARLKLGITQEELGKKIGYSGMAISYFENGERTIKISDLDKFSEALQVDADYFFSTGSRDLPSIFFRRGFDNLTDEEKSKEREALKEFNEHIRKNPQK